MCIMLTEKRLDNIHKLPKEDILKILHECAEALGIVTVEEFSELAHISKRTVYDHIEKKIIPSFEIGNHKFPLINLYFENCK